MVIRAERVDDLPAIAAVHVAAFPTPAEARVVDALRKAGRLTISLLAEQNGIVGGHVALSPVTIAGAGAGLGLGPLAVLPQFQRQGIGKSLINQALAEARKLGTGLVVVLGAPAYYGRFGFSPASELGLSDEYGGGGAFQAIALLPGAARHRGVVQYAPEFALFGC